MHMFEEYHGKKFVYKINDIVNNKNQAQGTIVELMIPNDLEE